MTHATFQPRDSGQSTGHSWFFDDGDEANSTLATHGIVGDGLIIIIGDAPHKMLSAQFRNVVSEEGGADGDTADTWELQYALNDTTGTYTTITGATSVVQMRTASQLTDQGATTRRLAPQPPLPDPGSVFIAGEQEENGNDIVFQLTGFDWTEFVHGLDFIEGDLTLGDRIDLRLSLNGGNPGLDSGLLVRRAFVYDADDASQVRTTHFRFYEDGTEAAAIPLAAQDLDVTLNHLELDRFMLRFLVQNTGAAVASTSYNTMFRKNGGPWRLSGNQFFTNTLDIHRLGNAQSSLTDNNATVQRLTGGTGSNEAGLQDNNSVLAFAIGANNYQEHIIGFEIDTPDIVEGDTLEFILVQREVGGGNGGTLLLGGVIPKITFSSLPTFQNHYRMMQNAA